MEIPPQQHRMRFPIVSFYNKIRGLPFSKPRLLPPIFWRVIEYLTHKKEQEGTVLTSEFLSNEYYKLYEKYSGHIWF